MQVTEGQVEWAPLIDAYDRVAIGDPPRWYDVVGDAEVNWKPQLKRRFPGEEDAIDKYFDLLSKEPKFNWFVVALKIAPKWIVWIVLKTGEAEYFTASLVCLQEYKIKISGLHANMHYSAGRRGDFFKILQGRRT